MSNIWYQSANISVFLVGGLLFACKSEQKGSLVQSETQHETSKSAEMYDNEGSTENDIWNGECKTSSTNTGYRQSPIAVKSQAFVSETAPAKAVFNMLNDTPAELVDNGHTIKVQWANSPGSLTLGSETFNLKQFHFHAHSEHTLDGSYAPLETHFVFMNDAGNKAVAVGFLSHPDAAVTPKVFVPVESLLSMATKDGSIHGGEKRLGTGLKFDLKSFFSGLKGSFYTYEGSLTTPPCSQIVTHMVYKDPFGVSPGFLKTFNKFYTSNYRKLQAEGASQTRNLRVINP